MTIRPGRIYANALARCVHASSLRFKTIQSVRDAEQLYDRAFPKGACLIETAHDGNLRILSPDESQWINVSPKDEGRLFKYTTAPG